MAADSPPFSQFVAAFAVLQEQLACPACEGGLRLEEAGQQVSDPASQQVSELASQQVSESANQRLRGLTGQLVCTRCGLFYPIVDGIPVLTIGTQRN